MVHTSIKKYFNLLSYLSFSWLIVYFAFLLFSPDSFAQDSSSDSAFSSVMCNVYSVVTSTAGKSFAVFAVLSVGIGFFSGKVSWGLMVGASMGVALIFGAPSLIATLTGDNDFKCETGVTYVTTCELGECYSCPIGFSGLSCDRCAIGFDNPPDCDVCALEYTGSRCDECDGSAGYLRNKDTGRCELGCSFSGVTGIRSDTAVEPGSGYINCNDTNFSSSQSVFYSCTEGNEITSVTGQCDVCSGNYEFDGSDCDQCLQGYTLDSGCRDCDSSAGWYEIFDTGICDLEATTDGTDFGITGGQSIRPPQSWITCDAPNFQGGMTFVIEDGTIIERDGSCVCATGYDPDSSCVSCADGYRNLDDGNGGFACLKVCDIPASVKGISATWVEVGSTSESCDQSNYSGTLSYTCSESGVFTVTSKCDVTCSGSTPLEFGDDNIHVFTSGGTFTCPEDITARVLIVGGGGSGGSDAIEYRGGGGGGGGAVLINNSYVITANTAMSISVASSVGSRNHGQNSSFNGIVARGGGRGANGGGNPGDGGSGGGGTSYNYEQDENGDFILDENGDKILIPNHHNPGVVISSQQDYSDIGFTFYGNNGGPGGDKAAGGGGGAGGVGEAGVFSQIEDDEGVKIDLSIAQGGPGIQLDIHPAGYYYGAGGGARNATQRESAYGRGGMGNRSSASATGADLDDPPHSDGQGGVVIIRYKSRNR